MPITVTSNIAFAVTAASIVSTVLSGLISAAFDGSLIHSYEVTRAMVGLEASASFFQGLGEILMYTSLAAWTLSAVQRLENEIAISRVPSRVPALVTTAIAIFFSLVSFLIYTGINARSFNEAQAPYYSAAVAASLFSMIGKSTFTWAIVVWTTNLCDCAIAKKEKLMTAAMAQASHPIGPGSQQLEEPAGGVQFRGQAEIPSQPVVEKKKISPLSLVL
ncbi:hypothetical protein T439DRAFT_351251 [Meredithblackwellia eburnea MCA 4105]